MLIEVPMDVFGEDVPEGWEHTPSYATRVGPDPDDVDRAAAVLAGAERPVIYAGQGVHYAEAWHELKALAEEWNIPVTTTSKARARSTRPIRCRSGPVGAPTRAP